MVAEPSTATRIDTSQSDATWRRWILAAVLLIILLAAPFFLSTYPTFLLFTIYLYISLAQAWNLLGGYTGLISLGQGAFLGIGAYSGAMLMNDLNVPLVFAAVGAGLAALLFALLISPPVFRFRGIYFAIGTMAVGEALRLWMVAWPATGGSQGYDVPVAMIPGPHSLYYIGLVIVLGTTIAVAYAINSKLGKGLRAIRDNEAVAQSVGVNVFRAKLVAFLLSSFVTGAVGAVWAANMGHIEPYSIFNMTWTLAMVVMVVIGGVGTLVGPVIGALLYILIGELLADYYAVQVVLTGVMLILVIRFAPEGVWGLVTNVPRVQRMLSRLAVKD